MTQLGTNSKREVIIETAGAIGFALATLKSFMEPTGVTPDMCHEAIERMESVKENLLEMLND